MASNRKTGDAPACIPKVTRRSLVVGASAPLLAGGVISELQSEQVVAACENWLALNAEAERLQERWNRLEQHLVQNHHWFKLTERQRCALPEAQELFDIDERLETLREDQEVIAAVLPNLTTACLQGIAAKLAVAAVLIEPEDFEEAHLLLASILRDIQAMTRGGAPIETA